MFLSLSTPFSNTNEKCFIHVKMYGETEKRMNTCV